MNLRYLFFNDGILYWGSIFGGVTLLTVITIILKLLKIARINPAAVSYTHLTLPTTERV